MPWNTFSKILDFQKQYKKIWENLDSNLRQVQRKLSRRLKNIRIFGVKICPTFLSGSSGRGILGGGGIACCWPFREGKGGGVLLSGVALRFRAGSGWKKFKSYSTLYRVSELELFCLTSFLRIYIYLCHSRISNWHNSSLDTLYDQ